jgi:cysteine synthase A
MAVAAPSPPASTPLRAVDVEVEGVRRRVLLKLEGTVPGRSIKDRTARALVDALEASGRLRPGACLVESTSGNLGVALARLARARGLGMLAVVDPLAPAPLVERMRALGARVEVVAGRGPAGHLPRRLERVAALLAGDPRLVWTDQYGSAANPEAHRRGTGPELLRQTAGRIDALFVAVSTGGTLAGLAACMRARAPWVRVVAVDVHGSAALGGPVGPRRLSGIGSGRPSAFLAARPHHAVERVGERDAVAWCRRLAAATGVRVGASSGAVLAACARHLARRPELVAPVCVCADAGEAYADTVYDDRWARAAGLL